MDLLCGTFVGSGSSQCRNTESADSSLDNVKMRGRVGLHDCLPNKLRVLTTGFTELAFPALEQPGGTGRQHGLLWKAVDAHLCSPSCFLWAELLWPALPVSRLLLLEWTPTGSSQAAPCRSCPTRKMLEEKGFGPGPGGLPGRGQGLLQLPTQPCLSDCQAEQRPE